MAKKFILKKSDDPNWEFCGTSGEVQEFLWTEAVAQGAHPDPDTGIDRLVDLLGSPAFSVTYISTK